MAGFKMGTNGRVCLNSSGQAIKCDCCECSATCQSGTTPVNGYILTASLIDYTSIMSGCWTTAVVAGTSWKPTATPPNPNGTFTLPTNNPDCCNYFVNRPATGAVTFYSDTVCGGVFGTENIVFPSWRVRLNQNGDLQILYSSETSSRGFPLITFAYTVPVSALIDCRSISVSNALTTLGALFAMPHDMSYATAGTGGSVTLTAI